MEKIPRLAAVFRFPRPRDDANAIAARSDDRLTRDGLTTEVFDRAENPSALTP